MKLNRRTILTSSTCVAVAAVTIAAVMMAAGAGSSLGNSVASWSGQGTSISSGFEMQRSISELAATSDIVVRGRVVSSDEQTRQSPAPDLPPGESRSPLDEDRTIRTIQFQVDEYLKGSGPQMVPVFQSMPVNGPVHRPKPELGQGEEYVLFLFSTRGAPPWADGYLIVGPTQGYWNVDGENVRRPMGWQVTMTIEELRKQISRSAG